MSRLQDSVIDDDEESCPLCIEEFDLSDKNFRPCPCGYQICQFCFNSLKNTYEKSTCPNCRRPYDEKTIQYKIPTAEEFKADQLNKNKKQAAARRKETEKKEVETSNRRNLAGVRVKQQNLVYVIGLVPSMKDESTLLQTLRGPDYFGQYGDIDKIVVSKAKPGAVNQGIGVYVTYARKEDAALCIQTIDGSANGDRVLRAQFGTTKYCSAYLRGETCMNKSCSFLHETGEDGHNSSLQNEPHIKKAASTAPSGMALPPRPHSTAQSVSSQPMARQGSKDSDGRKGSTDASALPSTASWATSGAPKAIRRPSQSTSRATPSPQLTHASLASQKAESKARDQAAAGPARVAEPESQIPKTTSSTSSKTSSKPFDPIQSIFDNVLKSVSSQQFQFVFSDSCLTEEEKEEVENFPVMIDPYGGAKRRVMQDKEAAERARIEADTKAKLQAQATSAAEDAMDEENMGAGSLALGGEPEDNPRSSSARGAIGRPSHPSSMVVSQLANLNLDVRSLTPEQRHPGNVQQAPGLPQPLTASTAFDMSDFNRSAPTLSQAQYDQISSHQRHGSRYFNSDSKSTPASRFQGQQQSFYSSGIQGPPPGLPASGTPPVSGGGMFAHGNNFSNPGFGTSKDANAELSMRGRSGTNDVSKRGGAEHLADPSIVQARLHQGHGAGQGMFAGNSVDETNFPPLPNPIAAYQPKTRPLPPPIRSNAAAEAHPQAQAQTGSSPFQSHVSSLQSLSGSALPKERERGERAEKERSSTPRVPPGFETSLPPTNISTATSTEDKTTHAHPEVRETYTSAPPPAQSSTLLKATPVIPVVPIIPNIPIGSRSRASTPKPTPKMVAATPSVSGDASGSAKGKAAKDDNVSLGSPKPKAKPASQVPSAAPGEIVAQPKEKEKDEVTTTIPAVAAASSAATATAPATLVPSSKDAPISTAQSKQLQKPSKIEIPAKPSVGENATANNRAPATPLMTTSTITSTPGAGIAASPPPMSPAPSTPATAGSASEASAPVSRPSVVHAQPRPRTLRVTTSAAQQKATGSGSSGTAEAGLGGPSATTEQSSSMSTPGTGTHAAHAGPKHGARIASRQASVSSAAPLRGDSLSQSQSQSRPSTPAMSERLTSEGASRASSPPPSASASIVGSAAERKTKNQAKKERREKAKSQGLNKSIDATPGGEMRTASVPVVEEVAPIVARQKKQKKNKEKEKVETAPKGKASDAETEEAPPQSQKEVQELSEVAAEKEEDNNIDDDDDAGPDTPVEFIRSGAEASTMQRQGKQKQEDRPSFTLRNLYECLAMEAPEDRPAALQDLLDAGVSDMDRIFEDLLDSGDLSRDHPWFNNVSFNGPGYRLPSDARKGQEYLNAHGYVGNHAFGYVYLPGRERRALERGDAVGIANGGNGTEGAGNGKKGKRGEGLTQDDLLKRCLITPGGVVYRHLSAEESDKVLELEERGALYVEEFGGDVGGMQMLETPLEGDDYINLSGGMEELGRYGEKHGVVWVGGEDDGDEEDGPEDDEDGGMISDETDDLGIELDQAGMPGPWDDVAGSTAAAAGAPPNTLPPMRNQPTLQLNLRALDLDALQKRVQEKQREAEEARKEIEKMEKGVAKTKRETAKWRDGILAVKV